MNETKCHKELLAGVNGCSVSYCHDCDIVELSLGAINIRLDIATLHQLQAILQQALIKLSVIKATRVSKDFDYDQLNLH